MANQIDAYLAAAPADMHPALAQLRAHIRAAAPDAVELINYGVQAFKLDGRPLVSFGYAREHCTFYVQSTTVLEEFAGRLQGYRLGKGSVRFDPVQRLPAELVGALVQARIAENASRRKR